MRIIETRLLAVTCLIGTACGASSNASPDAAPASDAPAAEVSSAGHDAGVVDGSRRDAADATGDVSPADGSHPADVATTSSDGGLPTGLHTVRGTGGAVGHLLDGSNAVVKLHGADRSGTEFACTYEAGGAASAGYPGFFDGANDQAGVAAMAAWHINAVRVPLNEDCWLGINGLPFMDTAANYQAAITQWVDLLNKNGMVAILDLHWAAPGTTATSTTVGQLPMTDADHAPAFWTSVATTFKGNSSVIFDLFNEPFITDWTCWTQGAAASAGCAKDKSNTAYAVAGMATLLKAVRGAGATNVVILGGLGYSSDFSSWVTSVETIPTLPSPLNGLTLDNVAASYHAYDFNSAQSTCPGQYDGYSGTCSSGAATAAATHVTDVLAAGFPLVIGELGISAFSASTAAKFTAAQITDLEGWLDSVMTWTEGQGQSYIGWSWNTDTDPLLVTDYAGTPTPDFGVTYKAHLQSL